MSWYRIVMHSSWWDVRRHSLRWGVHEAEVVRESASGTVCYVMFVRRGYDNLGNVLRISRTAPRYS